MEIHLSPELYAKLTHLASQHDRDCESLVIEAVERMLNHDTWFLQDIEKGIAAADRGEFVDHEHVRKLIDRQYPG